MSVEGHLTIFNGRISRELSAEQARNIRDRISARVREVCLTAWPLEPVHHHISEEFDQLLLHVRIDSTFIYAVIWVRQTVVQWIRCVEQGRRGQQFHVSLDGRPRA